METHFQFFVRRRRQGERAQSYTKDGKTVTTAAEGAPPSNISVDVFANFAQFVYDDENPENPIGPAPSGVPNTDAFLLGWQVGPRSTYQVSLSSACTDYL